MDMPKLVNRVAQAAGMRIAPSGPTGLVNVFSNRSALGIVIGLLNDLTRLHIGEKIKKDRCYQKNTQSSFHAFILLLGQPEGKPVDRNT